MVTIYLNYIVTKVNMAKPVLEESITPEEGEDNNLREKAKEAIQKIHNDGTKPPLWVRKLLSAEYTDIFKGSKSESKDKQDK